YKGDRSRKETLVEYGFRLPSALDNRPLRFEEWEQLVPQLVFVSATPGPYEAQKAGRTVEQLVRPTGLVDPLVEVSSEALPAFIHCVARHFQAVRSSPGEVKRLSDWLKTAKRILEQEFPVGERRNSAELDRTALELCRITARAWAPRRKGYKTEVGKATTPSASVEGVEHHAEDGRAQVVPMRRGKLRD
ncbi:MAG: hypothetical protein ORN83_12825, partial [Chthoniobacteraceae bacterium]|nr:hypothetical protein [Chthoniobacteraceae bacterium]